MTTATVEQVLEVIKKANAVQDIGAIVNDKPLSDQGVDSLDLSGILFNLEEVFEIDIPDEDIDGLQTINDIVSYINNK